MNNVKVIAGDDTPKSSLPFSPAIHAGDYIFFSGQASVDMKGNIVSGTFAEECRRTFDNLEKVLKAAGVEFENIVQVRNYVGKQEYLQEFNKIYREYFKKPYPARTTITGCLGDMLKFEVDAIAYAKK